MNNAVSDSSDTETPGRALLNERLRLPLLLAGVIAVAAGALYFWLTGGRYMSTDDAYLQAARVSISSNVAGRVVAIAVHDNQHVRRGDLLFRLDDQPFRIAVASARAKLGKARLQIKADKARYRERLAALAAAKETLAYRQKEFQRIRKLLQRNVASQSQYDRAEHALDDARQQMVAVQHQVDSALATLGGNPDINPADHPEVQQAQADLDRAELDLSYTRIRAPEDGIVTKVEQLQAGDYIGAGDPVFALISTRDVWVEANFKENQLTHMRSGQPATVTIDAYPSTVFHARVASLAPGTGSEFSTLPPENATGNWVKVVQRVPVRLTFASGSPPVPLHAGLSAEVEVDTGHHRGLFGSGHD